jgi:hypothetical protein
MDDEHPDVLTIGRLAHRTGLPVRTLRFWSDEGAVVEREPGRVTGAPGHGITGSGETVRSRFGEK